MTPKARKVGLLVVLAVAAVALWILTVTKRRDEIRETEAAGAEAFRRAAIDLEQREARRASAAAPKPEAEPVLVAGVDPDCYGDGLICDRSRVKDAEQLSRTLEPTLTSSGWPVSCFLVQYIGGEETTRDAISVSVSGPRGAGSGGCHDEPARRIPRTDLTRLAKNVRQALAGSSDLIREVDLLQVTDGAGGQVQLPLP